MTKTLRAAGQALLLIVGFASLAFTQTTATLSGTVVDPAGAVIPGASVAVTNKATSTVYQAVTDGSGTFTSVPDCTT
jgi:hypothetical protein